MATLSAPKGTQGSPGVQKAHLCVSDGAQMAPWGLSLTFIRGTRGAVLSPKLPRGCLPLWLLY